MNCIMGLVKKANFYLTLSRVNEQLRTQITWFNTSQGQNGKCFSHVLKIPFVVETIC